MKDFIFIKINQKDFILAPESVKEIIKTSKIMGMPNVSEELLGITNYRGKPLPVFNTPIFLGERSADLKTNYKLIITSMLNEDVAFVITDVDKIIELDETNLSVSDFNLKFNYELVNSNSSKYKNGIYFIKITVTQNSEMAFLRIILALDILKEQGEIIDSIPKYEDIENDNFQRDNVLLLFSSESEKFNIESLCSEITKISEIEKVEQFKIADILNIEREIKEYFDKNKSTINILDFKKIENQLKEIFKIHG